MEEIKIKSGTVYQKADGTYCWDEAKALESFNVKRKCSCGAELQNYYSTQCWECKRREQDAKQRERISKIPVIPWDGKTPLFNDPSDTFIMDEDDLQNFFEDQEPGDYAFIVCVPNAWRHLDYDYWADEMPDNMDELPKKVEEAIDNFNAFLDTLSPISYRPGYAHKVILNSEDYR